MKITCRQVTDAIESEVDLSLQESYDNTGWQLGRPDAPCSGVMLCVDVLPGIIEEAVRTGCNLVISHHPLLFKGLKRIIGDNVVSMAVMKALESGVGVYSLHTALDNSPAPYGVSLEMGRRLGLVDMVPLDPSGAGAVGYMTGCHELKQAVERVKTTFSSPVARCSDIASLHSSCRSTAGLRVALCGGSGSFLVSAAVASGADMFISSDIKYHDFVDFAPYIFMADIGHYEAERCTTDIIFGIIREKIPNFAIQISSTEKNPITYL